MGFPPDIPVGSRTSRRYGSAAAETRGKNGNSMAAEVHAILRQSVPTEAELNRRREFQERMAEYGPRLL